MMRRSLLLAVLLVTVTACADYDVLILGGTVYDGTGSQPMVSDIAIDDGLIVDIDSFPRNVVVLKLMQLEVLLD